MGHLTKYPALAVWYKKEASAHRKNENTAGQFIVRLCEALSQPPANASTTFSDYMDIYFNASSNPLESYLNADAILNNCQESLLNIISNVGELAVRHGNPKRFLSAVVNAGDKTSIAGLRFLSAWISLNIGELEHCVSECEKVDEPFSSIYTILGQALLELRKPQQAIEALNVAVKLAPKEVLAWFQLAKAHYSLSNRREAFKALSECDRVSPNNIEIALFQSIIANESDDLELQKAALISLKPHQQNYAGDAEVVFNLLKLAALTDNRVAFDGVISDAHIAKLKSDNRFPKLLSPLLRILYEKSWMEHSAHLLTEFTNCA